MAWTIKTRLKTWKKSHCLLFQFCFCYGCYMDIQEKYQSWLQYIRHELDTVSLSPSCFSKAPSTSQKLINTAPKFQIRCKLYTLKRLDIFPMLSNFLCKVKCKCCFIEVISEILLIVGRLERRLMGKSTKDNALDSPVCSQSHLLKSLI